MTPAILILAGGAGLRMGGVNKALIELQGRPLIAHLLERVGLDGPVAVASHDAASARMLADFGPPVLTDGFADRRGPLAGVLAGLRWLKAQHPDCAGLVSLPVDSPFLSREIAHRLAKDSIEHGVDAVYAACGEVRHFAVAYWSVALHDRLEERVTASCDLSLRTFFSDVTSKACVFPETQAGDFVNLNTPEAVAQLARSIGGR
jgi:molybdopterin-guanine dinucleotide biosynthesis protein A